MPLGHPKTNLEPPSTRPKVWVLFYVEKRFTEPPFSTHTCVLRMFDTVVGSFLALVSCNQGFPGLHTNRVQIMADYWWPMDAGWAVLVSLAIVFSAFSVSELNT